MKFKENIFLYSCTVKAGDKVLAGCITLLHKAIFDSALQQIAFQLLVFLIRNLAVDFRIFVGAAAGNVLVHQAEHYLPRLEVGSNPVDNSLGIVRHSGIIR